MKALYYFECHINIEPVFDGRLEQFKQIAAAYSFKAADLLMKKREADTPQRSQNDTFATGRGKHYEGLYARMVNLIEQLKANGFKVYRYKIEDTLIDSRVEDEAGLLTA